MRHCGQHYHRILSVKALRYLYASLTIGGVGILYLGQYTDVDLMLADSAFSWKTEAFPWRHAWLTETLNHLILKWVLVLAGTIFVLLAVVDTIRPVSIMYTGSRVRLRIVALSVILVPGVVSLLKQVSGSHCPWDLLRYGGTQSYVRILEGLPFGAAPGHCLPAGHASSSLWIVSLAIYFLPSYPRKAWAMAVIAISLGGGVGYLQQLRGAHFLTHTLWSIWISCLMLVFLINLLQTKIVSSIKFAKN